MPPQSVAELVEKFQRNEEAYRSGHYNEAQLRIEFLDPFFEALGWDVSNRGGAAEAYKDVIHEDAIKVGEGTKAPDYCFRIGGTRKFFVEAKKPAVNIKKDGASAFQLRRYAWSSKLTLSVLTNFAEFSAYDCRVQPGQKDKASAARVLFYTYQQYVQRWDEIVGTFSKDAVIKGFFDKFITSTKLKKGTAEVDDAFLAEIEGWRRELASNIALRNAGVSHWDLNFAVQRTIDRIIFLRICEDRGIEPYGQLQNLQASNIYQQLCTIFERADERYNSGLFHFHTENDRAELPDKLTLKLQIDDDRLKRILKRLYYPDSPYEFSVLSVDILGQVYEQFLGKVITLTPGHHARVEDKPELKKAGGVYYTPTYVVDYIVRNTVGRLVEGKTPNQVSKIRILDPACGSGSFLIGAYTFLLNWHRDWYLEDGPAKHAKEMYQGPGGEWRLIIGEKKRILRRNIYGVDVDQQAVEVTKLSLLLKVLEGESEQTLETTLRLFHERALPDLGNNLKCGNSLIDLDFYKGKQLRLIEDDVHHRVNPFDWKGKDGFSTILNAGGFDAIIGNPPYRRELDYKHLMDEIAETTFGAKYRSPRMDLWYYFVHRGLELLKPGAYLSFIVNAYWTAGTGAEKLIASLRTQAHIDEILLLRTLKVFRKVSGSHMLLRLTAAASNQPTTIKDVGKDAPSNAENYLTGKQPLMTYVKTPDQVFRNGKIDLQPPTDDFLLAKLDKWPPLSSMGIIRQGIAENPPAINRKTNKKYGNRWNVGEGVFMLSLQEIKRLKLPKREQALIRPYHDLCDLGRYYVARYPSRVLIYSTKETCPDINQYPHLRNHLIRFRPIMEKRRETKKKSNSWWHLHWPRDPEIWNADKVLSIQMAERPAFVATFQPTYVSFSVNVFVPANAMRENLNYITALLNSRLLWRWYQHNAKSRGGLEINGNVLSRTPIRVIDFDDDDDKNLHDLIVDLVNRMYELKTQSVAAKTEQEKVALNREIEATDREIDNLVYHLYDLNDEETAMIEGCTQVTAAVGDA